MPTRPLVDLGIEALALSVCLESQVFVWDRGRPFTLHGLLFRLKRPPAKVSNET